MSNAYDSKFVLKSNESDHNKEGNEVYDKDKLEKDIRENVEEVEVASNKEVEQDKETTSNIEYERLMEKINNDAEQDKESSKTETRKREKRKRRATIRRQRKKDMKREKRSQKEAAELGLNLDLSPTVSKLIVLILSSFYVYMRLAPKNDVDFIITVTTINYYFVIILLLSETETSK